MWECVLCVTCEVENQNTKAGVVAAQTEQMFLMFWETVYWLKKWMDKAEEKIYIEYIWNSYEFLWKFFKWWKILSVTLENHNGHITQAFNAKGSELKKIELFHNENILYFTYFSVNMAYKQ